MLGVNTHLLRISQASICIMKWATKLKLTRKVKQDESVRLCSKHKSTNKNPDLAQSYHMSNLKSRIHKAINYIIFDWNVCKWEKCSIRWQMIKKNHSVFNSHPKSITFITKTPAMAYKTHLRLIPCLSIGLWQVMMIYWPRLFRYITGEALWHDEVSSTVNAWHWLHIETMIDATNRD